MAACVEAPASPAVPAEATCSAESLQHLVGQPENAFDPTGLDEPVRVVHPDEAVTMDYNPGRLNVEIGADGMIAAIRCG
nr:I78 family peptidase inhibitor [Defluviimonas salinarum]